MTTTAVPFINLLWIGFLWGAGGIVLLSVLLLLTTAILLQHTFVALNELVVCAKELAAGDFTTRVPPVSQPELEHIFNAFNRMAATIQELVQRIKGENTFLQTIIDAMPDLIFFKDKQGVYLGCNAAFAMHFIGRPKEEIVAHIAQRDNELTVESLDHAVDNANRLIKKMSTTITDFRNFFSPDKEMVTFSALEQLRQAVNLVEAAFASSSISITIAAESDCRLHGFPNEYSQVLINLLTNARDAIVERSVSAGRIVLTLRERRGMGQVPGRRRDCRGEAPGGGKRHVDLLGR